MEFDHQLLSKNTFCLIEPQMVEHLPQETVTEPIVPAAMAESAHLLPRLLVLATMSTSANSELLNALFNSEQNGEQPVTTMLVRTSMDAHEFMRHWNGLQVAMPVPGRQVWLRLQDPRVLHQLLRILSAVQRKRFFDKIESISYWIGDSWITAAADASNVLESIDEVLGLTWDWRRVEQIGIINRALQGAGVRTEAEISRCGQVVEQLITSARECHGLSQQGDLVEYAILGLTLNPDFDKHPAILRAIQVSTDPTDDARLSDRLALIDDQVWTELGRAVQME